MAMAMSTTTETTTGSLATDASKPSIIDMSAKSVWILASDSKTIEFAIARQARNILTQLMWFRLTDSDFLIEIKL